VCKLAKLNISRGLDEVRSDLVKWLVRLGVLRQDIIINSGETSTNGRQSSFAEVSYAFKGRRYSYRLDKYVSIKENLGAIEMLVHGRVLGVERGVESFESAFAGWKLLEHKSVGGSLGLRFFEGCKTQEELKSKRNELIKQYHPDKAGGSKAANDIWSVIQEEYDVCLKSLMGVK
jgi:hypothetical protein